MENASGEVGPQEMQNETSKNKLMPRLNPASGPFSMSQVNYSNLNFGVGNQTTREDTKLKKSLKHEVS